MAPCLLTGVAGLVGWLLLVAALVVVVFVAGLQVGVSAVVVGCCGFVCFLTRRIVGLLAYLLRPPLKH